MKIKNFKLVIISLIFLLFIQNVCAQEKVFVLGTTFFLDTDNVEFDSISVNYASVFVPNVVENKTIYTISLLDVNSNTLFSKDFSVKVFATGGITLGNNISMLFFLPYYENAKTIEILKGQQELLSVDLATLCNKNSMCEPPLETYFSCPQDCQSGSADGVCDKVTDGRCDQDCALPSADPDCLASPTTTTTLSTTTTTIPPTPSISIYIYILIFAIVIAVILFFFYRIRLVE
jgi:hypothetical protein